jgi:type VI secretion system secreted protein VgrG
MSDLFELQIDGETWAVSSFRGVERIGRPPRFEIVARPPEGAAAEIGAPVRLTWPLEDGGERAFNGIVDATEERPGAGSDRFGAVGETVISCVPRAAALADTQNHAVFVDEDALAVAEKVLAAHGQRLEVRCQRTPETRAQCVQAFESDLDFVTRILAEEGIAWFIHPDDEDVVVAVNDASGFEPIAGGGVPVRPSTGLVTDRAVWGARLVQRAVSDKVSLRDYDFRAPSVDLTVEAKVGEGVSERYEYRAGYTDPSVGRALAQIHLEEHRRDRIVLEASTALRGLAPGRTIEITEGPVDGIDGEWMLTLVEHAGGGRGAAADERPYTARFEAVRKDAGYRPTRHPRPTFGGVQTMTVTGSSGAEIHTEGFGRSKARFRWERERAADDTASAWLRSVQPPTSGGLFLPRVGWEVLATHMQGSPDEPLELGRLYNATDPPPARLPAKKVVSTWGTRTTPGGGSASSVSFDDTAGNEGMTFTASRVFNELTDNDKTTHVIGSDTWTVGGDRSTLVGKVHGVAVTGAQSYAISANRTVNVNADKIIKSGTESVTIGGARIFDVGGDSQTQCADVSRMVGAAKMVAPIEHQSLLVMGASSIAVGGSWRQLSGLAAAVDVGGASAENVAGAKSITTPKYAVSVKGALTENLASRNVMAGTDAIDAASSKAILRCASSVKVKGADVIFTAQTKIKIEAGGVTLTITPGSVTIAGKFDSSQSALDDSDEAYD